MKKFFKGFFRLKVSWEWAKRLIYWVSVILALFFAQLTCHTGYHNSNHAEFWPKCQMVHLATYDGYHQIAGWGFATFKELVGDAIMKDYDKELLEYGDRVYVAETPKDVGRETIFFLISKEEAEKLISEGAYLSDHTKK